MNKTWRLLACIIAALENIDNFGGNIGHPAVGWNERNGRVEFHFTVSPRRGTEIRNTIYNIEKHSIAETEEWEQIVNIVTGKEK